MMPHTGPLNWQTRHRLWNRLANCMGGSEVSSVISQKPLKLAKSALSLIVALRDGGNLQPLRTRTLRSAGRDYFFDNKISADSMQRRIYISFFFLFFCPHFLSLRPYLELRDGRLFLKKKRKRRKAAIHECVDFNLPPRSFACQLEVMPSIDEIISNRLCNTSHCRHPVSRRLHNMYADLPRMVSPD